jgi:hypothetical protein
MPAIVTLLVTRPEIDPPLCAPPWASRMGANATNAKIVLTKAIF